MNKKNKKFKLLKVKFVLLSFVFFLSSGCTLNQKITYSLKDLTVQPNSQFSDFTLGVKEFEDIREPIPLEKIVKNVFPGPAKVKREGVSWFFNSDDYYEGNNVSPWVSNMLAQHLNKIKVFKKAEKYVFGKKLPELFLQGKIKKFEAFKERSTAKEISSAFGLLGVLGTIGLKSRYEGETVLTQIKLINASNNAVLWEGEVEGRINGTDRADSYGWSVYRHANLSLKEAVSELGKKLMELTPAIEKIDLSIHK